MRYIAFNFINEINEKLGIIKSKIFPNMRCPFHTYSYKEVRFKLIQEALNEILEDFHTKLLNDPKLGLSLEQQSELSEDIDIIKDKNARYQKLSFIAQSLIQSYRDKLDEKFWSVYNAKLAKHTKEYPDIDFDSEFEEKHIYYAIRNAFFLFLGLVHVIPQVYKRKYIKFIKPHDYQNCVANSYKLVRQLTKIHFDVFRAFLYVSSETKSGVSEVLHNFRPDYFQIDRINDKLLISFNERLVDRTIRKVKRLERRDRMDTAEDKPLVGCPAIHVDKLDNQDLVDMMFEWTMRILHRYFFEA